MGLGKTLTMIALILKTKVELKKSEKKDKGESEEDGWMSKARKNDVSNHPHNHFKLLMKIFVTLFVCFILCTNIILLLSYVQDKRLYTLSISWIKATLISTKICVITLLDVSSRKPTACTPSTITNGS